MGYSRRTILAGATALGATVLGGAGTSAAETGDGYDWADDGDYIERSADLEELRTYMPYLRFEPGSESKDQLIGLYGWKAESPDHDTDAYCYWARYTHQNAGVEQLPFLDRAFGVLRSDSHLWDHEPSYIFVDKSSGQVERAIVTGYHHFALDIDGRRATLTEGEVEGLETHLNLQVIDPWHHYSHDRDERGVDVTNFASLDSWLDVRPAWQDNGFYKNSNPVAIDNPWSFLDDVHSWWADDTWDYRAGKWWHRLGLRGADQAAGISFD